MQTEGEKKKERKKERKTRNAVGTHVDSQQTENCNKGKKQVTVSHVCTYQTVCWICHCH
uniref:Uncharacterized protein n=1 Tax=Arundo donax TaxID=35708 RepID=A0A0A8ZSA3_ARUDO